MGSGPVRRGAVAALGAAAVAGGWGAKVQRGLDLVDEIAAVYRR